MTNAMFGSDHGKRYKRKRPRPNRRGGFILVANVSGLFAGKWPEVNMTILAAFHLGEFSTLPWSSCFSSGQRSAARDPGFWYAHFAGHGSAE